MGAKIKEEETIPNPKDKGLDKNIMDHTPALQDLMATLYIRKLQEAHCSADWEKRVYGG